MKGSFDDYLLFTVNAKIIDGRRTTVSFFANFNFTSKEFESIESFSTFCLPLAAKLSIHFTGSHSNRHAPLCRA